MPYIVTAKRPTPEEAQEAAHVIAQYARGGGTFIEVVAVDDAEYARAIDAGMNGPAVPGVAEPAPVMTPEDRATLAKVEQLLAKSERVTTQVVLDALTLLHGLLAEREKADRG